NDLRFSLGAAYGGDSVKVAAIRGKERIERTLKLVGELPAFRHAFLGILPMRPADEPTAPESEKTTAANGKKKSGEKAIEAQKSDDRADKKDSPKPNEKAESKVIEKTGSSEKGVVVRMVYDSSPAAEAGVQVGDRITEIDETKIDSIDDAIGAVNSAAPGNKVVIKCMRATKPMEFTLSAARLPSNIP